MRRRPFLRLIAAFPALLTPNALQAVEAQVAGSYVIDSRDDRFGGLSGLEMSDDGRTFHVLSDRAVLFSGRVERTQNGAVADLTVDNAVPLEVDGSHDSEGLAIDQDGRIFVSFEIDHRIVEVTPEGRQLQALPQPRDFARLQRNAGLEALAVAPNGALYALAEGQPRGWADRPVYRFRDGTWSVGFSIPRVDYFRPVGTDFGPDGRLYVLERDFWGLLGFRTRLRRIAFDDSGLIADDLLWETQLGDHSNLEGIAIWQDAEERLRATLISDNNFTPLVTAEIVDLILPD